MSLHFFGPANNSSTPSTPNPFPSLLGNRSDTPNKPAGDESSDSEGASYRALIAQLQNELRKDKCALIKLKNENSELNQLLFKAQEDMSALEQKSHVQATNLYQAATKIKELEELRDAHETKLAQGDDRISITNYYALKSGRLEKEVSQLRKDKELLQEENCGLVNDVKELRLRATRSEELMEEITQLRMDNARVRRELVAAKEQCYSRSIVFGNTDEEGSEIELSPIRMVYDGFEDTMEGVSLQQELRDINSPSFIPSPFDQFSGFEDTSEVPSLRLMKDVTTQTDTSANSTAVMSTQTTEIFPSRSSATNSVSTLTPELWRNVIQEMMPYFEAPIINASGQTFITLPRSVSTVHAPIVPDLLSTTGGYSTANIPFTPLHRSLIFFGGTRAEPPSSRFTIFKSTWMVIMTALLFLGVALLSQSDRINVSSMVTFLNRGLKFQWKRGLPAM